MFYFNRLKNLCFLFCLILSINHFAQAEPVLQFGTFHRDENMFHKQLLKQAYQKLDILIAFVYLPGERSLTLSNSGKLDGEVARLAEIEESYPNLARVNVALQSVLLYAYSNNPAITISDNQSLKAYRIAYLRGVKSIEKQFSGFNLEPVTSIQQAFTMLVHNRVDIVITGDEAGAIDNLPLAKMGVKKLMPPVYQFSVYHYLNKKHQQLIPKLEAILTKIIEQENFKEGQ
jgi:polar amino acid transport system substrate-binding protein